MKEGRDDTHKIDKDSASADGEKMVYGIPENDIVAVAERVSKGKESPVRKEVLIAIIKDMGEWHDEKKSFSEALRLSVRRWTGNNGDEYYRSVLSAIGILYANKRRGKAEIPDKEEDVPSKGYKDFY